MISFGLSRLIWIHLLRLVCIVVLYVSTQCLQFLQNSVEHIYANLETGHIFRYFFYVVSFIQNNDAIGIVYFEIFTDLRVDQIVIWHQYQVCELYSVFLHKIRTNFMLAT